MLNKALEFSNSTPWLSAASSLLLIAILLFLIRFFVMYWLKKWTSKTTFIFDTLLIESISKPLTLHNKRLNLIAIKNKREINSRSNHFKTYTLFALQFHVGYPENGHYAQ